jgi:uncharacterized protein (TIRG00374 family)
VLRYVLPLVVLGLAVHLILPQIASLERSYKVIQNMALWALAIAVLAQALSYLGSGYLLRALVSLSRSSLSAVKGAMITLAAASFGTVAGGMVGSTAATYRWLQKENVNSEAATLAGTIPGLFNNTVLVLVSIFGLIHLLSTHQLSRVQMVSFAALLAALCGFIGAFVWGLRYRAALTRFVETSSQRFYRLFKREYDTRRIRTWLESLFSSMDVLVMGGWRRPLLGAALNVAFDMLTLYFLFIAAGHRVGLGVLLTGYGLPLVLGRMAFLVPGGVGVIEGTMVALFDGLGVPDAVSIVVVLAYRILSFWLPLFLGFPLILILQRNRKR